MDNYKIINGETIEELRKIPDETFDMIFADPPYNMQTEGVLKRTDGSDFAGVNDDWDKFESIKSYEEFSKQWISECKRVLKDDGTMWIIGSFQNIYILGNIIQNMGFWILNDIIWRKTNPVPNFGGTRFCNAHETIIWFKKDNNSSFTFNYHTMKYLNGGKQAQSIWEIPICIGNERLKNENGEKLHNTQKPLELMERIILSSTKKGDLVLDPFSGTATTGAAAIKYQRKYVGIEKNNKYVEASMDRLKNQSIENDLILTNNVLDIKPPRVPMKKLIETNYIKEGDILTNKNNSVEVVVNEKGNVIFDGLEELSIHKAGARVEGKTSCNGWTYWYHKDKGVLIDEIRKEYRKIELDFVEIDI